MGIITLNSLLIVIKMNYYLINYYCIIIILNHNGYKKNLHNKHVI